MSDRLSLRMPTDLRVQLAEKAKEERTNMSKLALDAIRAYLNGGVTLVEKPVMQSVKEYLPYKNHSVVKTIENEGLTFYDDDGVTVLRTVSSVEELFDYIKSRQL